MSTMTQGDKSSSTITCSYNEYSGSSSYRPDNGLSILIVGFVIFSIIVIFLITSGQNLYHTYYCIDKIEEATILGQELIKHYGAYGTSWYEYRNTILIDNSHSTIDSMELMTDFRPKDNITIRSTYRKSDMTLLSTEYTKE